MVPVIANAVLLLMKRSTMYLIVNNFNVFKDSMNDLKNVGNECLSNTFQSFLRSAVDLLSLYKVF